MLIEPVAVSLPGYLQYKISSDAVVYSAAQFMLEQTPLDWKSTTIVTVLQEASGLQLLNISTSKHQLDSVLSAKTLAQIIAAPEDISHPHSLKRVTYGDGLQNRVC
jgi:hypothetical protein